jgi:dihydropteroate synthase
MMHMKGTPQDMKQQAEYENIGLELVDYFSEKISQLHALGVKDIILDPGFGFAKTLDHNYELLSKLEDFKIFDLPVLVGFSRKSMVYQFLESNANEALNGTTVLHTIALLKGACMLRVHDVKEARECIRLTEKLRQYE